MRYLAKKYSQESFASGDFQTLHVTEKWMDWAYYCLAMPRRNLFWNLIRYSPELRSEEKVARGNKQSTPFMTMANAQQIKTLYLAHNNLGI